MTYAVTDPADSAALEKMLAATPHWTGLTPARAAVGLEAHTLLHAGPAFDTPGDITAPVLNSACVAAVYEGLADDFTEARAAIARGDIRLEPAQDRDVVTPLAAVVSSSMRLQSVVDTGGVGTRAFAPLNGGSGPAPRLGLCSEQALAHLRWMNSELADVLGVTLGEPVDLLELARLGLAGGDDCHGRTPLATGALIERLAPGLPPGDAAERVRGFLAAGPSFFLNLWMAACRCMLGAAAGVAGASLVIGAGANGARTGIQVAGLPGRWFCAPADPPHGRFDADLPPDRALGAIGDSAIVDAVGLGAMAMGHAPAQQQALLEFMPPEGLRLGERLLGALHPRLSPPGVAVGLTARAVVEQRLAPVVSLGILDREGTAGRLGGGIFTQPLALFDAALTALAPA